MASKGKDIEIKDQGGSKDGDKGTGRTKPEVDNPKEKLDDGVGKITGRP